MTRRVAPIAALLLFVTACAGESGADDAPPPPDTSSSTQTSSAPETAEPPAGAAVGSATTTTIVRGEPTELPDGLEFVASDWLTDFSTRSIDLEELLVGIPASDPRDLIPPIDDPVFESADEAGDWLSDDEPGILVEVDGTARWYPIRILHRHEIVNDRIGDTPIAVTYCPLCNTALVFDPVVDGTELRFGVSGLLRNSDLVMWDDFTQSLWQQITGEAIVGELTGTRLEPIGSAIVRFRDAVARYPDVEVLGRDQGFGIPYGANPYVGYSGRARPLPFFEGEIDDRFPALERVVGVSVGDDHLAVPFSVLTETPAINVDVGDTPVAILWGAPTTTDALDGFEVAAGEGIGTGVAYLATVDGQDLTFSASGEEDRFTDEETGSTWTLLGQAVEGPLEGEQLELATHRNEFWFAWQSFFPGAMVIGG